MTTDQLRPITALFADITGSTRLGERLAPDEVKALIGECVTRMSAAVEEFGGTVQAYQGDGICAYFGVPTAHEDDPERAARAALRIVELMAAYGREVEAAWGIAGLNVRVGVNSGRAGVGQVGSADPQTVALGDATNVAARLESSAAPGTIAIGETTAQRLAGRFATEPLGPLVVKGRDEPVQAYRLVGAAPAIGAEDAPAGDGPFIGRDEELRRMIGVIEQLASGRGQVVVIGGEAGIGKSRLLAEVRGRTSEPAWHEGRCLSYGARAPFGPFVEILRAWLGGAPGDADLAVRTRLRARLGTDAASLLPPLARLLGVRRESGEEDPLAGLPADELASALRSAYVEWVRRLAFAGPVVIAVEDVNWADGSSGELATDLIGLADHAPVGVVLTLRPEPGTVGWTLRTHAISEASHRLTLVDLVPLSPAATEELATRLVPDDGLDPATRRVLAEVSEGNPLYLIELLARLRETGALAHHEAWTLTVPRDVLPPALEGLLVARVDQLSGPPRTLIEAAAVIGRRFERPILERVVGSSPEEMDSALGSLLRAGIIVEAGRYPDPAFEFRHGLLHEAVLGTLTDARRADLHLSVARAIEAQYPDGLDAQLEVVAHHYARAHDLPKALEYLERGAERAESLGASDDASRLWLRALRAANRLGDDEAADRIRARVAGDGEPGQAAEA
jgi:class 3 adenylate cyclase